MPPQKKKYYAVARGRKTGIFSSWTGPCGAEQQVKGFSGACYKGFATLEDAQKWLADEKADVPKNSLQHRTLFRTRDDTVTRTLQGAAGKDIVEIYTDGGCLINPGPGGYGVVIIDGNTRKELSGGYRLTTNNRMELTACIEGLRAAPPSLPVRIYSDSRYIVNAINHGWAYTWRKNGWIRSQGAPVENSDLWDQLLSLCDGRSVEFVWIKGHAGTPENERCDRLAAAAMARKKLPPDRAYESGRTRMDIS